MSTEDFIKGYLDCAAWLAVDAEKWEAVEGLDASDFTKAARAQAARECKGFLGCLEKLGLDLDSVDASGTDRDGRKWSSYEMHGHDFFLTRNHHGMGYWDRDYGPLGDELTKAAHTFGESTAILSRRGKLSF